jgi:hypothetical protein
MIENHNVSVPLSPARRQARRLRIAAAALLLLGVFGADLVYWLGTRTVHAPNPLPVAGEDKAETRRMEMIFGKQTIFLDQLGRNLQRPGTQAVILVVVATLAAGGCFYFARLLDHASDHAHGPDNRDAGKR